MDKVFRLVASLSYYFQYFFAALFNEEALWYLRENSMYQVYASIPARMYPGEIVFTAFFGIFSALAAAWAASRNAVTANISEVLHDE
jgi:lipoprotein-releasing system permease protein